MASVFAVLGGMARTARGPLTDCVLTVATVMAFVRSLLHTATVTLGGLERHVKRVLNAQNGKTELVLGMVSASMDDVTAEKVTKTSWTVVRQIHAHEMNLGNSVQETASA